nr:nuclear transport factor 2 family protein [Kineosporia mesophila]
MALAQVARYYEQVDADDVGSLLELFAPDAVYRRPGYPPFRGRAELERFYRDDRVIVSGRHTISDALAGPGGSVAVRGRFAGLLRDGQDVDIEFADFFVLDGENRFRERETFFFTPLV